MYLRDVVASNGTSVNGTQVPDADNGPRTVKTVWSLFVFATVFILLRLYSKARRMNPLWWDDYVLLASCVSARGRFHHPLITEKKYLSTDVQDISFMLYRKICFLVACAQLSVNISDGFGRPSNTLEPDNLSRIGLGDLVLGAAMALAASGGKTSCAITLGKVSGPKLTIALWSIAVSMNVLQATSIVLLWARCTPLEKEWNPTVGGSCWTWKVNFGVAKGSAGARLFCAQKSRPDWQAMLLMKAPYQRILGAWP